MDAMEDTRLGAILMDCRVVPEADLRQCLEIQALTGGERPLGEILVERGVVSERTLQDLLTIQSARRERLRLRQPDGPTSDHHLRTAVQACASELHMSEGRKPLVRVGGELCELGDEALTGPEIWQFVREHMGHDVLERIAKNDAVTQGFAVEGVARGRITAFRHFDGLGVSVRLHPVDTRSCDALDPHALEAVRRGKGLVLLIGEHGAGVSETFATLLNEAAQHEQRSIIVVDDVFEYPRPVGQAIVSMRVVGEHTPDWESGVRSALREDPDAIFIGGTTTESFELAMHAAESGRLVVCAVNGRSTTDAITRLLQGYPRYDAARVRSSLASVLDIALTVRVVPTHDDVGFELATEVLRCDDTVSNLIRGGSISQLSTLLDSPDRRYGHGMDSDLLRLIREGRIRFEDAFAYAENKTRLLESAS